MQKSDINKYLLILLHGHLVKLESLFYLQPEKKNKKPGVYQKVFNYGEISTSYGKANHNNQSKKFYMASPIGNSIYHSTVIFSRFLHTFLRTFSRKYGS